MVARTMEATQVGDTFGPVAVPVDRQTLVAYANASGDQNPIHQDEAFAVKVGLPNIIAHGMWTMGASVSVLSDWVGDAGKIRSLGTRFTSMVIVPVEGAELEVSGRVTALDVEAGTAEIEITTAAAGTKVLGRCRAVVALG